MLENAHTREDDAVVVVVCNENGDVLLLLRSPRCRTQGWCLPGGGIEKGEISREAAVRELKEETGIEAYPSELTYISRVTSSKELCVVMYSLPRFSNEKIVLSREHTSYAWALDAIEWAGNTEFFLKIFHRIMEESMSIL